MIENNLSKLLNELKLLKDLAIKEINPHAIVGYLDLAGELYDLYMRW